MFFNCEKKIKLKDSFFVESYEGYKNVFILKKNNKGYILNRLVKIPKNKTLIIENGVEIKIKRNGSIINNGTFIVGDNKKIDSLFFFKSNLLKDVSFPYNVILKSKNENFIISGNGNLILNGAFVKKAKFNYNGKINFNNSLFFKSKIELDSSIFIVENSFLDDINILVNNSDISINNSLLINTSSPFYIKNLKNILINNCIIYNNNGFVLSNVFNGNFLNSIFLKNTKTIDFNKNNKGHFKIYNNLIIDNKNFISKKDSSNLFLLNNIFDRNKLVLKNYLYTNNIISKNNIFSFNDSINIKTSHSYCLSNTENIEGYFNIIDDPFFVDNINYNYKMRGNSKAIRSGNNNVNIGPKLKHIYYYKYLK